MVADLHDQNQPYDFSVLRRMITVLLTSMMAAGKLGTEFTSLDNGQKEHLLFSEQRQLERFQLRGVERGIESIMEHHLLCRNHH
jgi:hypothetical protein